MRGTKRLLSIAVSAFLLIWTIGIPAYATDSSVAAVPTASKVYVDGNAVSFSAYNINGHNYFKLRDLAYVLNGTGKQFSVGYDNQTSSIALILGKSYTATGSEMSSSGTSGNQTATPTSSQIYIDLVRTSFTAYNIGGSNYFMLRALAAMLNFSVSYDNATGAISVSTKSGYTVEDSSSDDAIVGRWGYEKITDRGNYTFSFVFNSDGTFTHLFEEDDAYTYTSSNSLLTFKTATDDSTGGDYKLTNTTGTPTLVGYDMTFVKTDNSSGLNGTWKNEHIDGDGLWGGTYLMFDGSDKVKVIYTACGMTYTAHSGELYAIYGGDTGNPDGSPWLYEIDTVNGVDALRLNYDGSIENGWDDTRYRTT